MLAGDARGSAAHPTLAPSIGDAAVPPVLAGPGELAALMRAHDWSGTPLGAPDAWPPALGTLVGVMLGANQPMFVAWGPERTILYNDRYAEILADKHPAALGRPLLDVWHEVRDDLVPIVERTYAGEPVQMDDLTLLMHRNGRVEETHFAFSYTPVRDAAGSVAGLFCACTETTGQVMAERRLRESEARANGVLEGMAEGFVLLDAGFRVLAINAEGLRLDERPREAVLGRTHWEAWPGSEDSELGRLYKRAMRDRVPVSLEHRYVWADGHDAWIEMRGYPSGDGLALFYRDISQRKRAEARLRESEDHYRQTVELNPQTVWTSAPDGQLDGVSQRFLAWTGTGGLGGSWAEAVHPQDLGTMARAWARSVATGEPYDVEHRIRLRDGSYRAMHSRAYAHRDEAGRILKWYGTTEDVHERRAAEEERAEGARTLEVLNRTGAVIASELDLERLVQIVTDAGVELTGARIGAFFYNVANEAGESMMLYTLSGAERAAFDGFGMPRATNVFAPTFKGEGIVRSDDILTDLRYGHSAPHHGTPAGHPPVRSYLAVSVTSRSGEVLGGLFFGHEEPGVFTRRHEDLVAGIAGQAAIAIDNARLFQATQRLNEELEARVAERTRELHVTGARQRAMFDATRQLIGVLDLDGTLMDANRAALNAIGAGLPDVAGRPFWETPWFSATPGVAAAVRDGVEAARNGRDVRAELALNLPGGSSRSYDFSMTPVRDAAGQVVEIVPEATDITDQRRTEEQLRQAQKMEAVGQLTGGIAHDFNNMLAVVIGSLDLLGRRLGSDDARARRYVDAATEGARRAALLTQRLLAFSRQQPLRPEPIEVNKLVTGMSDLIRGSMGSNIRLETVLAGGAWRVHADPNGLENVVLNLAVNARDAMPEGGRLTIETQNAHLDARYVAAELGVPAGQYVLIAVTDTGAGMLPQVIARAFDPFFTTKEVGKGTGLGLSQAYGFVKQSGGHVKIYSEPGQGTTVKVYLPRYVGPGAEAADDGAGGEVPLGERHEVVLVVEDEAAVRQFSVEALGELGYRVLEADGAAAALRLLDAHPEIALLFTDVVMPEVNGRKLADEARRRRPGLRVLFTTGYTRNAVVHNGVLDPGVELIGKPFTLEELAARLREILDAPGAGAGG